jgi:CYTH domain-containing protein
MEIERKFLVRRVPDAPSAISARLRQGYLASGSEGEVRVRDAAGSLTLTVKSGAGLARAETEIDLTPEQFDVLWPATAGRRIEKVRTRQPVGAFTAEVDVYEGDLAGLVVVEVEFPSRDTAADFEAPEWFGTEVTEDAGYKNASLALRGRPGR